MSEPNTPLVLVVEDYQDAREMYAAYLQFSGYRVAEATNGMEAIEKTIELLPDIILMDLALPRMDGWEATRRLKMDERTKHIPIVALTGHALAGHAEGARQAGCDSFVTKPCLPDALVAEIQRMLAERSSEPGSAAVETAGRPGEANLTRCREHPPYPIIRPGFQSMPKAPKKPKARSKPAAASRDRQSRSTATAQARGKLERVRMPPGAPKPKPVRSAAQPADESNEGKYVYCIVKSERELRFGPLGIGTDPADVHTVHYRDIAAVVSNTPMVVQDPTRDNVLAHQRVNETVMQQHTVIPMSFGTVFKTDDDIIELLRSAYDAFTDVLNKMQDKFEFGLKVLWDRDQIIREIEEEDEDIRRLKGEISSQKGSTYFARMQYGRMIDAALQARSERYVNEVFQALRDVSVASRSNKPIGDRMIMNAAFLVGRALEPAFDCPRQGDRAEVREADVRVPRVRGRRTTSSTSA